MNPEKPELIRLDDDQRYPRNEGRRRSEGESGSQVRSRVKQTSWRNCSVRSVIYEESDRKVPDGTDDLPERGERAHALRNPVQRPKGSGRLNPQGPQVRNATRGSRISRVEMTKKTPVKAPQGKLGSPDDLPKGEPRIPKQEEEGIRASCPR